MATASPTRTIDAVAAEFTDQPITDIIPITDGAINETHEVVLADGGRFILQAMSPIFGHEILNNLATIQPYVKAAGVLVPECLPTLTGDWYVNGSPGRWFRALSYIPGVTIHDHISAHGAASAGRLVGQFHSALVECSEPISDPIKHFHDTPYYMERLQTISRQYESDPKHTELAPLVTEVLTRYHSQHDAAEQLPTRIIHGDLKASNFRFDEDMNAIALIDMDTLMHSTVKVELGDGLRSMCGTKGEDSAEQVFDRDVYDAALAGYTETASAITPEEIASIPHGIRMLTLELTSRFLADAYEETYFAKSSKYPSLYEQNKTRAHNQLHFLNAFEASGLVE